MNYNFAMYNENLISIQGLGAGSTFVKIHKARRDENFSGTEQNKGVQAE